MRTGAVIAFSLSLVGCAAAFRPPKDTIHVDSTPVGAEVKKGDTSVGLTPTEFPVDRKKSTELTISKSGYEQYKGIPRRHINGAWITLDIATCVFPVALCIPLLVDALTGAWYDVDDYHASMKPGSSSPASAVAATGTSSSPPPVHGPPSDMSESERKATARAAYLEGVKLQEGGACPDAVTRFETAQRFYPAATHLLHLAQCQAATGKLVEASETYETLVRSPLTKDSPEAFRQAQEDGKKELGVLRPRIPTLRVQVVPAPASLSSLVVKLNGHALPSEVLGIARPVNPGHYKVTVWAAGYRETSSEADVDEGKTKAIDLKLAK